MSTHTIERPEFLLEEQAPGQLVARLPQDVSRPTLLHRILHNGDDPEARVPTLVGELSMSVIDQKPGVTGVYFDENHKALVVEIDRRQGDIGRLVDEIEEYLKLCWYYGEDNAHFLYRVLVDHFPKHAVGHIGFLERAE